MNETIRNLIHLAIGFLLFPVTVLGVVPGILIAKYGYRLPHPTDVGYWFSKLLLPGSVVMILWTVILFFIFGRGTPAPWAPPKYFVVLGPYRFVRNPMMVGVLMGLLGEALIISSMPIAYWLAVVFAGMNVFIIFFEEPGLEKRFGDEYRLYKQNVGRWIPRTSGWIAPWEPDEEQPPRDPGEKDPWQGYEADKAADRDHEPKD